MSNKKIRVLLELRPALEGFAGIPQEVRLLFRGLKKLESIEVAGMLQTSSKVLSRGVPIKQTLFGKKLRRDKRINRFSKVIISMTENPYQTLLDRLYFFFEKRLYLTAHTIRSIFFRKKVKLSKFESKGFEDFIWRTLFSKTLPASDFCLVTQSDFYVNSVPWEIMHRVGLWTLSATGMTAYNRLSVSMADIFIGQTPYPARIVGGAKMVIRYHDAIPIFMPHTISNKSFHQASHYYALAKNVKDGAWFACVSNATRNALIRIFPEAERRSVTIYNMISHHYFDEDSPRRRVPEIVRARLYNEPDLLPDFFSHVEKEKFYKKHLPAEGFDYLLVVSTIEPRKNHLRLIAAWEALKSDLLCNLKLIVVGTLGWDNDDIIRAFKSWIDRGELFMLNAVPAYDLRVLYKHALATVCPSLEEGFDYSGIEAMASGGITIASDIPAHREVYEDAAEYFDPYSTISLVKCMKKVLYEEGSDVLRKRMLSRGKELVQRYQPDSILPQWETFLRRVVSEN